MAPCAHFEWLLCVAGSQLCLIRRVPLECTWSVEPTTYNLQPTSDNLQPTRITYNPNARTKSPASKDEGHTNVAQTLATLDSHKTARQTATMRQKARCWAKMNGAAWNETNVHKKAVPIPS